MSKSILKYLFIVLLFVSIIAVPIFGLSLYNSPAKYQENPDNYFVVPSIFDDNAILTNIQFGGGSSVYLSFDSEDEGVSTEENLKKGAEILEARFQDRGYTDASAKVEDGMIRLDFAQKTYLESVVAQIATIGEWSFVGSDMTNALCDASMVKDAYVSANSAGGFGITLEFTEDGASEFFANTASYAVSGSSFYLMMDGQLTAMATISDSSVRETFTFGQYEYESAAIVASMIKNGELPATVQIEKTEPLPASLGKTLLTVIAAVVAIIVLICIVLLFVKGKSAGIFGAFAILSDIAVFLIAMLSASYQLNFVTLITMTVLIVLATVIFLFALEPIGKSLKEKKIVSAAALSTLSKFNVKSIWIHGILLAAALICYLFARGSFLYIVRISLIFACANAIFYFLFVYFGVRTLAESKK